MDFSSFQKTLAQNKVYDAWQYVQSLNETLAYMNMSAELLEKVYAHRIISICKCKNMMVYLLLISFRFSFMSTTI